MNFAVLDGKRYQVLNMEGKLIGTVTKEVFTTYPHGTAIEAHFWVAQGRGYIRIPGRFETRKGAAEALVESLPKPRNAKPIPA